MQKVDIDKITDNLSSFLDSLVKIYGRSHLQQELFEKGENINELGNKLDILERAIELARVRFRCLENKLDFDKFIQSEITVKSDHFFYCAPVNPTPK